MLFFYLIDRPSTLQVEYLYTHSLFFSPTHSPILAQTASRNMGDTGTLPQLQQIAVAASRQGQLVVVDDLHPDRQQHEEVLFKSVFTTPHPHVGK